MFFYATIRLFAGGNETGSVLVFGRRLLHLGVDGFKVSRHFGAARSNQPKSVVFVTIRYDNDKHLLRFVDLS